MYTLYSLPAVTKCVTVDLKIFMLKIFFCISVFHVKIFTWSRLPLNFLLVNNGLG